MVADSPLSTAQWFVIHTNPRQEQRAVTNLRAAGIETFLPEIKVKKYNPYSGALSYLYKPLFPRYLFAGFVPSKTTAVRWRCELFMSPAGLYRNCSFSRNCAHTGKEW
jgi:hypothetical protein